MVRQSLRILSVVCSLFLSTSVFAQSTCPGGVTRVGDLDPAYGQHGVSSVSRTLPAGAPNSYQIYGPYQISSQRMPDGRVISAWIEDQFPNSIGGFGRFSMIVVRRILANGAEDPSFGSNGTVVYEVPHNAANVLDVQSTVASLSVHADGRVVISASSYTTYEAGSGKTPNNTFFLIRFLATGALDATFGRGGVLNYSYPDILNSGGADLRIVKNGAGVEKYLLLGGSRQLYRLNLDGSPDADFGTGGAVSIPTTFMMAGNPDLYSPIGVIVTPQSDGKYILAGMYAGSPSQRIPLLARLRSDGTVDASFGSGGVVIVRIGTYSTRTVLSPYISPSGEITIPFLIERTVGIGQYDQRIRAVRVLSDGNLDIAFGDNGIFEIIGWNASLTLDSTGRIYVGNTSNFDYRGQSVLGLTLDRYSAAGAPDIGFGNNGRSQLWDESFSQASGMDSFYLSGVVFDERNVPILLGHGGRVVGGPGNLTRYAVFSAKLIESLEQCPPPVTVQFAVRGIAGISGVTLRSEDFDALTSDAAGMAQISGIPFNKKVSVSVSKTGVRLTPETATFFAKPGLVVEFQATCASGFIASGEACVPIPTPASTRTPTPTPSPRVTPPGGGQETPAPTPRPGSTSTPNPSGTPVATPSATPPGTPTDSGTPDGGGTIGVGGGGIVVNGLRIKLVSYRKTRAGVALVINVAGDDVRASEAVRAKLRLNSKVFTGKARAINIGAVSSGPGGQNFSLKGKLRPGAVQPRSVKVQFAVLLKDSSTLVRNFVARAKREPDRS